MNANNDGNILGRLTALALIIGAVYGVHMISLGGLGCPLGDGSCCAGEHSHSEDAHALAPAAGVKAAPDKDE